MPIYLFECEKCSNKFEIVAPMREASEKRKCPKCKSSKTFRDYAGERHHNFIPHTLGHLADLNSAKMSQEEKDFKSGQNSKHD